MDVIKSGGNIGKDVHLRAPVTVQRVRPKLRFEILKRDGFKCRTCGSTAQERQLEVDHKRPRQYGGSNEPENLWTLCIECNRGKGSSFLNIDDFVDWFFENFESEAVSEEDLWQF